MIDHCNYTEKYRRAAHNSCNLNYKAPKETPIAFYFIIKELAKKFEGQYECLKENKDQLNTN